MKRGSLRFLGLISFSAVILGGCGTQKAKEDAERVVAQHFDAIAHHDYEHALWFYGEEFFSRTSRPDWLETLQKAETKLGPFQSYRVTNWNVNTKFGTGGGTYVSLACEVWYGHDVAEEEMILFRAHSTDDFKIMKHGINSPGLFR